MPGRPIERAKIADRRADVRVVDVAVDVVGAKRLGMQPPGDRVGRAAQRGQVVRFDQPQPFVGRQPFAGDGFLKQWRNRGRQDPLPWGTVPAGPPARQTVSIRSARPARGESAGSSSDSCMPSARSDARQRGLPLGDSRPPGRSPNRGPGPAPLRRATTRSPPGRPTRRTRTAGRSSGAILRPGPKWRRTAPAGSCMARSPISKTASARVASSVCSNGSGSSRGRHAKPLLQHDPHQGGARPRADVEGERCGSVRTARGYTA